MFAESLGFTFIPKGFLIDVFILNDLFILYVYAKKPRGNTLF